jgi:aspartate aminotransferase-like enzyme
MSHQQGRVWGGPSNKDCTDRCVVLFSHACTLHPTPTRSPCHRGHIDFLVSSSNKCIEGVPGFSFILARNSALEAWKGHASTLSLDIHKQADGFKKNSQFRFTPPTHAMMAFGQALAELAMEGGVEYRMRRYQENQKVLMQEMKDMGFSTYLPTELQGWIITSYRYPTDKNWNFDKFYNKYAGTEGSGQGLHRCPCSSLMIPSAVAPDRLCWVAG